MEVKDIPGWPGYQATADGQIIGCRTKRPRKLFTDKHGYLHVSLGNQRGGTAKNMFVHRAVVSAFLGPIPEGMQVNHKNGVRTDNRIDNLEIVTASQNARHAYDVLGRAPVMHGNHVRGEKHSAAKLTADLVTELRRLYADGMKQVDLASKFGISQANASAILRRATWAHVP